METGFAFLVLPRYDGRVDEAGGILDRMQRNPPNCSKLLRLSHAIEKFACLDQLPGGITDLLWKDSSQPFFADA